MFPARHVTCLLSLLFVATACEGDASPSDGGATGTAGTGETGAIPGTGGDAGETGATPGTEGGSEGTDDGPDGDGVPDTGTQSDGDGTGSGGSDETAGSSDDGEPACNGINACVALPPDGWNGPAALRDIAVDGVPDCSGDYPTLELDDAFSGLVADAYDCGCECGPGDVACDGSGAVEVSNSQNVSNQSPCIPSNGGNDGLVGQTVVTPADPYSAPHGADAINPSLLHGITITDVVVGPAGTCEALPTETPTEVAFTERTIVCSGSSVDLACGVGETCVARPVSPFEEDVCVWQEGDVSCPGAYPARRVRHRSIDDQRDCTECSCGAPSGDCDDATFGFAYWYTGFVVGGGVGAPTLTLPIDVDLPVNFCQSMDLVAEGFPYSLANSLGQISMDPGPLTLDPGDSVPCSPIGGEPSGEAVGDQPITICCADL